MTLNNIYNQTVTILNKLKRTDGITGQDVWYKTVVNDAAWYDSVTRTATVNATYIGRFITVLIPFHEEFLPYNKWKQAGNQLGHYTISIGDYIILGEVNEDITSQNIVKTMESYGENVCLVKYHTEPHERGGINIQIKVQGV